MKLFVSYQRLSIRSKSGFTLLETLIAVALLLIVSMFIYKGFMSTIQYSSSTSFYEADGQRARRDIHANIGARDPGTTTGLYIDSPTSDKVITISGYRQAYTSPVVNGIDEYEEVSVSPASIRFGFSFQQRACPNTSCTGTLFWYKHTDGSIQQKCNTCTYDSVP